jgi:dTDP-4-dehydrorhamnose 3,5-epimerase
MDSSRFLIVGANGQLGKALQAKYPRALTAARSTFDVTNWEMISNYDWSKVDVVLNAAAFTNVDGAETAEGREAAWKVNGHAVSYLAKIAERHGLTLVHISSDYVFDGSKAPHTEDETFTPLGIYAQTKAAGDIAVSTVTKHYILRASWVIGEGANFVRTMISLANRDISPTVVADQVGRLTFTSTLVAAIDHLVQTKAAYGTYNASNDGEATSWAEITREIFNVLGRNDLTVSDTTTKEYFASKPNISPRPLKSELDLSKIKATGFMPSDWQDELRIYIQAEAAKPKE